MWYWGRQERGSCVEISSFVKGRAVNSNTLPTLSIHQATQESAFDAAHFSSCFSFTRDLCAGIFCNHTHFSTMSDTRPRRDGGARSGPRRTGPPKRRELPEGYEVEVLPMPEEVPKPNNSAHRAEMDKIAAAIEKTVAERDGIQALIKSRTDSSSGSGAAAESKLARDRLNEIR